MRLKRGVWRAMSILYNLGRIKKWEENTKAVQPARQQPAFIFPHEFSGKYLISSLAGVSPVARDYINSAGRQIADMTASDSRWGSGSGTQQTYYTRVFSFIRRRGKVSNGLRRWPDINKAILYSHHHSMTGYAGISTVQVRQRYVRVWGGAVRPCT